MRIALTHAFCWPEVRRGGERLVAELGAALQRRGHDVVHFTAAWEPAAAGPAGLTTVALRRRFDDPHRHEADFARRLLPRLVRGRFDAVHALGRHDALAAVRSARLRRDGRRTVMTDLGLPIAAWWATQGEREARTFARAIARVDAYCPMSRAAAEHLAADYGRTDGVTVVPGGVELTTFAPAPARERTPTVLYSGALDEPRKGVEVLLAALAGIAEREPGVTLWLSGPGDPARLLAALPDELRGRVRSLGVGEPTDQAGRYGRAWVTCLPSMFDSFGLTLLESLACGTPIVATTHSAPQELVTPGVTGELSAPGAASELAAACLRALALARRPQIAQTCRAAAAPYDWERGIAPRYEALYAGRD